MTLREGQQSCVVCQLGDGPKGRPHQLHSVLHIPTEPRGQLCGHPDSRGSALHGLQCVEGPHGPHWSGSCTSRELHLCYLPMCPRGKTGVRVQGPGPVHKYASFPLMCPGAAEGNSSAGKLGNQTISRFPGKSCSSQEAVADVIHPWHHPSTPAYLPPLPLPRARWPEARAKVLSIPVSQESRVRVEDA